MSPSKKTVVVTGFGLFGDYEVNSSWVAVKELKKMGLDIKNVNLEIREVPVEYAAIDKKMTHLIEKYDPILIHTTCFDYTQITLDPPYFAEISAVAYLQLIVNVGVSGLAENITLEQCAHNTGYFTSDVKGKCPEHHCCKENGPSVLKSSINMQSIAESSQVKGAKLTVETSQDAGRYCCDYIYYTSLSLKGGNVAFVHTPPLNRPYSGYMLGVGLRAVIQAMLEYIEIHSSS